MQINWAEFTPILSLLGGMLIGGAALLLMLANGRVMGVSSILGGLLGKAEPKNWRLAFIAVAIFITTAIITVYMFRHGAG